MREFVTKWYGRVKEVATKHKTEVIIIFVAGILAHRYILS